MKGIILLVMALISLYSNAQDTNFTQSSISYSIPDSNNLISWWKGESNPEDFFGDNQGIMQGGLVYVEGLIGQAFLFSPTKRSAIRVPSDSSLNPIQITMEAWVRPYSLNSPHKVHIILRRNILKSGLPQYGLMIGNGENGHYACCNLFDSVGLLGKTHVPLEKWTHLACTYDGYISRLYQNGEIVDEKIIGQPIPESNRSLYIGMEYGGSRGFDGLIDEVTLYGKALSAQEIKKIYLARSLGKKAPKKIRRY